ncbi:hypothetical protein BCR44DRAFT_1422966 [Catenaria anguillulae PL171]|uniref:Uncharacterized protein n=1 Tax=Catenaria anguillulae PL171 TaxID=765915 RepID=A0A1Y2I447_9FUNG|nr:hypothetical protein BCR44DRAFT_1422966 [Catenaria anguillulae PL171]
MSETTRSRGPGAKAPDYGSGDRRFKSSRDRFLPFCVMSLVCLCGTSVARCFFAHF